MINIKHQMKDDKLFIPSTHIWFKHDFSTHLI